ncbi:phage tail terminator family protein [Alkaliphilus peptidifermentans]|uniref:Phage protein n=1 Tax=Alkaliphilus peptidifermentans DSM 18978 TaxID=1120976 RepID=A0A1G5JYN7_9FIRM|nr:hypothetical protein [Alkaliphilus peptidifermentans]SCY93294.1 hypothetical protein SAMN03080606_03119 [Alkaliphilus peptidifermentans DSM 18978]
MEVLLQFLKDNEGRCRVTSGSYNSLCDGIMAVLNSQFPNNEVFDEEVIEGANPPYFYVKMLKGNEIKELNGRYRRVYSFVIYYHTPDKNNRAMNNVAEELYNITEHIEIDGRKLRGVGMKHEIIEGALNFFVEYSFFVYRQQEATTKMGILEEKGGIKG